MATKANITVDQGSNYSTTVALTDDDGDAISLVGYTAAAQIRKHYTSTNAISFSTSILESNGQITISLTTTQTNSMTSGKYVYDIEIISSANVVSRVLEGILTITPGVTR
jgi:hypothetical protein